MITLLAALSPWSATLYVVRMGDRGTTCMRGLVSVIVAILLMAGVPKSSIILEKKGLRSCDHTRPGEHSGLGLLLGWAGTW